MSTTRPNPQAFTTGTYPAGSAANLTGTAPDLGADIGGLNLMFARIDSPTAPNFGGSQVADEFDDATGVGSLGSGVVGGPNGTTSSDTPTYATSGGQGTWYERKYYLTNGKLVTSIGIYATNSGTYTVKIAQRISAGSLSATVVNQSFSHPGGGWVDCTLATPYLIPASGNYMVGCYAPSSSNTVVNGTDRCYITGATDQTAASASFTEDTPNGQIAVRANYWSYGYLSNTGGYSADQIPTMTSYTAPSGTVTTGDDSNNVAWKAFDKVVGSDYWQTTGFGSAWVAYDWGSPKVITKYVLTADDTYYASRSPNAWTFQGWNGSTWVTLDTRSGITWSISESKTFTFTNTTGYNKYRLNVSAGNSGPNCIVAEINMMVTNTPLNITTVSTAFTAASVPTTATIVAEWQDISTTAVLNTDITFEVSRDGGTTWTAVTMASLGASLVSGALAIKGTVGISGQPSGTSMKWRIKTFNTKEQRVHGVWLQWK